MMDSMKSRVDAKMIKVHTALINQLKNQGLHPILQMLDKEISKAREAPIESYETEVQLV